MNLMSLAELLDRSLDILRKYIKSIVMFSLGYGIIMFIILIPVFIVFGIITAIMAAAVTTSFVPVVVLVLITIPLVIGISLSYYIGLIKIASQDILKEKVLAYDAIKASFKSFFKVLGIAAVVTALSLPLLAAFGVIFYFFVKGIENNVAAPDFFYDPFDSLTSTGTEILLPIIIILLVTFLLMFVISAYMNYFSFSLQALTLEKQGVTGSIKRSFNLVKGSFWRIFGCMTLFYLTIYAITASFQSFILLISGLVYLLMQFLNIPQDTLTFIVLAYNYASYPVSILSWLVISPVWVIMSTLLYYNQRFTREGYDMTLKLDEIKIGNTTMKASIPSETDT